MDGKTCEKALFKIYAAEKKLPQWAFIPKNKQHACFKFKNNSLCIEKYNINSNKDGHK